MRTMVRSFAFNIYFYALSVLAALVGIVVVPIPTPVLLRGLLHRYARAVAWGMRWTGGMKVAIPRRRDPGHRLRRHAGAVPPAGDRRHPLSSADDSRRHVRRRQGAREPRPV